MCVGTVAFRPSCRNVGLLSAVLNIMMVVFCYVGFVIVQTDCSKYDGDDSVPALKYFCVKIKCLSIGQYGKYKTVLIYIRLCFQKKKDMWGRGA